MKVKMFESTTIESLEKVMNEYVASIPDHDVYKVLYSTANDDGCGTVLHSVIICHRELDRDE